MYALVLITTRALRATNDVVLMTTYFIGAVAFGIVTVPFGWVTPTTYDLLFLAGIGISNIVAQFSVIRSLKLASASVVVPYQYTLIVWSVVFGWLIFAELPDIYTVVGAAIIVAAGLYIFWREQARARAAVAPAQIA
jgi:drug/metabolite transporter (DMT)-like permease